MDQTMDFCRDSAARPTNPMRKTGISGRGSLYYWGANTAADAAVFRRKNMDGAHEVLLIRRRDGSWALPGGFYRRDEEEARAAALRELAEETCLNSELLLAAAVRPLTRVYEGYAEDPRNTDEAWIETSVWGCVVDYETSRGWKVQGDDDAKEARWWPLSEAFELNLYGGHRTYLEKAQAVLLNRASTAVAPRTHHPLLEDISELRSRGVRRLGILGGSFDPVHAGHTGLAEAAMSELSLDSVLFIPAAQNPLKSNKPSASPSQRIGMLEAVLCRRPDWYVSDIEVRGTGPSYTIDTLRRIDDVLNRDEVEKIEIFLILGEDGVEDLPHWKEWKAIGRLSQIVIGFRSSDDPMYRESLKRRINSLPLERPPVVLEAPCVHGASSELRPWLGKNRFDAPGMLPAVADYLRSGNCYSGPQ